MRAQHPLQESDGFVVSFGLEVQEGEPAQHVRVVGAFDEDALHRDPGRFLLAGLAHVLRVEELVAGLRDEKEELRVVESVASSSSNTWTASR